MSSLSLIYCNITLQTLQKMKATWPIVKGVYHQCQLPICVLNTISSKHGSDDYSNVDEYPAEVEELIDSRDAEVSNRVHFCCIHSALTAAVWSLPGMCCKHFNILLAWEISCAKVLSLNTKDYIWMMLDCLAKGPST